MTTNTFDKLAQHTFSVGVELPLDNDWAHFDATKGTPFGVPDMTEHHSRIQLADKLGFKAAWVRDVPFMTLALVMRSGFRNLHLPGLFSGYHRQYSIRHSRRCFTS